MEERQMLSSIPTFETISLPAGSSEVVPLAPMQNSVVDGQFTQYQWWNESVQANLTAGELYAVSVDVQHFGSGNAPSGLFVAAPSGAWVANPMTAIYGPQYDLQTGNLTNDSEAIFRAPESGTYNFGVYQNPTGWTTDAYTLTIRPIALDQTTLNPEMNPQDAQKLQFSGGGLYAFLDPAQDTLSLVGPTGRGFQIAGQFSEIVTPTYPGSPLSTATITAGGTLTLESGFGNIPLPLPPGFTLQVTTKPDGYGGLFGEVDTAQIQFPYSSVVSTLVSPFGSFIDPLVEQANSYLNQVGAAVEVPGIHLGIGLGDQVSALIPDAPVNPAIPYFYLAANSGVSASIGQVELSVENYKADLVIDPADPSLYVHVQGLPAVSNFAVGISQNGYIPFTPLDTPTHFGGKVLYGDIYLNATLDLADLTEDYLPVYVSGNAVFNLDTSGNGWTNTVKQEALSLWNGTPQLTDLHNLAVGVNFSAGVSLSLEEVVSIDFPVVGGTVIYNGPTDEVDVAASTINPFANSVLAFLDNGGSYSVDGYVQLSTAQFNLNLGGSFSVFGYQIGNANLDVNNYGINVTGDITLLGIDAGANGWVGYNGQFWLWGQVDVNYGYDLTTWGTGLAGGLWANLNFTIDSTGNVSLSGSGDTWGSFWFAGVDAWDYSVSGQFSSYMSLSSLNYWTIVDTMVGWV
jgi:hypothetical protein